MATVPSTQTETLDRKYYSSLKWVRRIELKIKWKKFQFELLLEILAQPKHV
jgi:hypothetical protein